MYKKKDEERVVHEHSYSPTLEEGISKCSCGVEDLSKGVMEARIRAWDFYQEQVYKSEPYFDFLLGKAAFRDGDLVTIKEVAQRSKERLNKNGWKKEQESAGNRVWKKGLEEPNNDHPYISKSPFKDPRW